MLFIAGVAAQALLLYLDLWVRRREAASQAVAAVGAASAQSPSGRIDVRALGMLLFFILLYWGIQVGGMSLVPGAHEVLETTRSRYQQWSVLAPAATQTSALTYWLLGRYCNLVEAPKPAAAVPEEKEVAAAP